VLINNIDFDCWLYDGWNGKKFSFFDTSISSSFWNSLLNWLQLFIVLAFDGKSNFHSLKTVLNYGRLFSMRLMAIWFANVLVYIRYKIIFKGDGLDTVRWLKKFKF